MLVKVDGLGKGWWFENISYEDEGKTISTTMYYGPGNVIVKSKQALVEHFGSEKDLSDFDYELGKFAAIAQTSETENPATPVENKEKTTLKTGPQKKPEKYGEIHGVKIDSSIVKFLEKAKTQKRKSKVEEKPTGDFHYIGNAYRVSSRSKLARKSVEALKKKKIKPSKSILLYKDEADEITNPLKKRLKKGELGSNAVALPATKFKKLEMEIDKSSARQKKNVKPVHMVLY